MRGSVGRAVGAGVDGRTGNTTRATITGCFHVLILKNCRCQFFFLFNYLPYTYIRVEGGGGFGWVRSCKWGLSKQKIEKSKKIIV